METRPGEPTPDNPQDGIAEMLTDDEIHEWACDSSVAKNIAADLATSIRHGTLPRWHDLPDNTKLASDYSTSLRTVGRAKRLLADRGLIEKAGSHYFVA